MFLTEEEADTSRTVRQVLCIIYKNNESNQALIVLANPGDTAVTENLVVQPDLLGHPVETCTDVEVDEELPPMENPKNGEPVPNTFAPLWIDKYQFRLLRVE